MHINLCGNISLPQKAKKSKIKENRADARMKSDICATRASDDMPCGIVMMLPLVAVMRCVPFHLPKANITSEGCITHEVFITFREDGTHRSKNASFGRQKMRFLWWERMDSNHRSRRQQIYSLPPLATRELSHINIKLSAKS